MNKTLMNVIFVATVALFAIAEMIYGITISESAMWQIIFAIVAIIITVLTTASLVVTYIKREQ